MSEKSLSGAELAELGFPWHERESLFLIDRPEYKNLTLVLLGTYANCQAEKLPEKRIELDEAHEHIFGGEGCKQCQKHFNTLAQQLRKIIREGHEP